MVKRQMSSIDALHMYILNSLRRTWWCAHGSVRVSFFPELHRLNVASFHPRHFFSLVARMHFAWQIHSTRKTCSAKICSENIQRKRGEVADGRVKREKKTGKD